jgi:hypothetical protein
VPLVAAPPWFENQEYPFLRRVTVRLYSRMRRKGCTVVAFPINLISECFMIRTLFLFRRALLLAAAIGAIAPSLLAANQKFKHSTANSWLTGVNVPSTSRTVAHPGDAVSLNPQPLPPKVARTTSSFERSPSEMLGCLFIPLGDGGPNRRRSRLPQSSYVANSYRALRRFRACRPYMDRC